MKVMKFGGAVLKDEAGFIAMAGILHKNKTEPMLIVVSALSKVTRQLNDIAKIAKSGDEENATKKLDYIIEQNISLGMSLLTAENQLLLKKDLQELSDKLKSILRGIAITKELTPRTLDYVLSFGEYFALKTVYYFLKEHQFNIELIDSTDIIITDENFGNANPDYELSLRNCMEYLMPKLIENKIILTQGFVARTKSGKICTMGMESSNLTATFFAIALGCEDIIFWTDVEGIRTADPKIASVTLGISEMNYEDAYKSSMLGLKLLHHNMIEFAEKHNLNLIFRSVFNPEGDYTRIHRSAPKKTFITYLNNLNQMDWNLKQRDRFDILKTFIENDNFSLFKQLIFLANNLSISSPNLDFNDDYETHNYLKLRENISLLSIVNPNFEGVLSSLSNMSSKIDIINMNYLKSASVFTVSLHDRDLNFAIRFLNDNLFF